MTKSKSKYYVVWQGRQTGIYDDWEDCKKQIIGFKGAKYKGFPNLQSAENAFSKGWEEFWGKETIPAVDLSSATERPVGQAVAVDAACSGNPGKMEYQGVYLDFDAQPITRKTLFKSPVFEQGTNNIGEFLAIVHAVSLQKKNGWNYPVYSDSVNAQLWVRQGKCKTKLKRNARNETLFQLIERAEKWLAINKIEVSVLKWKTEKWGEIPADFGRK